MNKKISSVEQMNSYLKSIMDIMRRDKAKWPMEYIPELTWMMFVRLLDEKESRQVFESQMVWEDFSESLPCPYRWQDYAWKDLKNVYVIESKNIAFSKDELSDIIYTHEMVLGWNSKKYYFRPDFKKSDFYKNNSKVIDEALKTSEIQDISVFWDKRIELLKKWINLIDFINENFIPYIKNLKNTKSATSKQKLISHIFEYIEKTKISSERNLLDIFEKIHHISNSKVSDENFFAMSQIYESLLLKMWDKNSDWGQFFTPRSVIKAMITAVNPKVNSTFYDPCCGTGGFLAETYKYLYENNNLSSDELKYLSEKAFWWKDNSDTVFAITLANLVIHNISMPHIANANTIMNINYNMDLFENEPSQYDYIFTNPPFGGKENPDLIKESDFTYKTSNTQILFMQHILKKLKNGWECAVVLDEWVLFRTNETAFVKTKELIMNEANLHTIVSLPWWVFTNAGTGVKTNLLFFKKWSKTEKIWYYDMSDIKVNKSNPLTFEKFAEFLELYKTKPETKKSWFVSYEDIEAKNFDLKAVNPNIVAEVIRDPKIVVDEIIEGVEKIKGWMSEVKNSLDFNK